MVWDESGVVPESAVAGRLSSYPTMTTYRCHRPHSDVVPSPRAEASLKLQKMFDIGRMGSCSRDSASTLSTYMPLHGEGMKGVSSNKPIMNPRNSHNYLNSHACGNGHEVRGRWIDSDSEV